MRAKVIPIQQATKRVHLSYKERLEQLRKPTRQNLRRALDLLNTRHISIRVGGKHAVCDVTTSRVGALPQQLSDFKERYRTFVYEDFSGTKRPLGEIWLNWPGRRAYDGTLVFAPPGAPREDNDPTDDNFNTWRGFRIAPTPGDWSLFRDHLREVVCRGHEDRFEYLLNYFAHMVQRPGQLPHVCIVLRGDQGTGKTIVYDTFRRLFRKFNRALLDNPKHVVGQFNKHLAERVLVCADEAVFARAKETLGKLKSLITQPEQRFEAKHFDAEEMLNVVRLLIISNDEHVIHAARDERRYFVLETKDTYAQRPGETLFAANERRARYFDPITKQLEHGGAEALLYDLLRRPLGGFKLMEFPDTPFLDEQKLLSMEPHEKWLYDRVMEGYRWFTSQQDDARPLKRVVYENYRDDAKGYTGRQPLLNDRHLGRFLRKVFGPGVAGRVTRKGQQVAVYWFPPRPEAQRKLLTCLGISGGKMRVSVPKKRGD